MDKFKKFLGLGVIGVTGLGAVKGEAMTSNTIDVNSEKDKQEIVKDTASMQEGVKPLSEVNSDILNRLASLKSENEKLKQGLLNAEKERDITKAEFKAKIGYLSELKKNDREALMGLDKDIHDFIYQILEEKKESLNDPAFIPEEAPEGLRKAVLDAGNPPGKKLIAYAITLNKTDFNDDIKKLTNAEWQTYFSQYLFDKSEQEIKNLESIVKTSGAENKTDLANSK